MSMASGSCFLTPVRDPIGCAAGGRSAVQVRLRTLLSGVDLLRSSRPCRAGGLTLKSYLIEEP